MIDLDQMEREARSRLARKLSWDVAQHMAALAGWRYPSDVRRCFRWPGEPQFVTYHPIAERLPYRVEERIADRLEMVLERDGPTHKEVERGNVHNFERLGVPGVWLLSEIRPSVMRTTVFCSFEEVVQ